jgi:hypothetical protein
MRVTQHIFCIMTKKYILMYIMCDRDDRALRDFLSRSQQSRTLTEVQVSPSASAVIFACTTREDSHNPLDDTIRTHYLDMGTSPSVSVYDQNRANRIRQASAQSTFQM